MVGETLESEAPSDPPLRVYLAGGIALRGANGVTVGERAFAGRQARLLFVRLAAIHEAAPHVELADDRGARTGRPRGTSRCVRW